MRGLGGGGSDAARFELALAFLLARHSTCKLFYESDEIC